MPLPSLFGGGSNYVDTDKRDILLFFRGTGVRNLRYHTRLREAATQLSLYNRRIIIELWYREGGKRYGSPSNFWNVSKYGYTGKSAFSVNRAGMRNAIFVLAIRGYGLSSYRLVEALEFGAIPIIISDNLVLPYSDETINWSEIAFRFSESYMIDHPKELVKKLETLVSEKMDLLLSMQRKGKKIYDTYLTSKIEYIPIGLNVTFSNIIKATRHSTSSNLKRVNKN